MIYLTNVALRSSLSALKCDELILKSVIRLLLKEEEVVLIIVKQIIVRKTTSPNIVTILVLIKPLTGYILLKPHSIGI